MRVAVIDDDQKFLDVQRTYIDRVAREDGFSCDVDTFTTGFSFADQYTAAYDIIFLDIDMPGMNGLETAKLIRGKDPRVCIIFVTNLAQYAIKGYEVNALDFVVKPVEYFTYADKLRKALRFCGGHREKELLLQQDEDTVRLLYSEIGYLEKEKNYLVYHTQMGIFRERGTIAEKEAAFEDNGFAKCNSGCLVNLRNVKRVGRDAVFVGDETLPVSRQQRKPFVDRFMGYLGGER